MYTWIFVSGILFSFYNVRVAQMTTSFCYRCKSVTQNKQFLLLRFFELPVRFLRFIGDRCSCKKIVSQDIFEDDPLLQCLVCYVGWHLL